MTDWTTHEDEHYFDTYLFSDYKKAKDEFDKVVEQDKKDYYKDYMNEGWEHEEADEYWCVWETGNYLGEHSEVILAEKTVY